MRFKLEAHQSRLVLALFFVVSFLAYTWANHFPYFYHSDEESKALQLLYGYRNYWHPMLMLNATSLLGQLTGQLDNAQFITMVGRTLSAFFSSLGVVCFVQFAWRRKGPLVGILTGLLLLTLPLLFEVSHYCKEDPALFMGLALGLLALDYFLTTPDVRHVIFLGMAAGIATSAKYPGALLIVALLPVVFHRTRKLSFLFLLTVTLTVLAINWQWLTHIPELFAGIRRESGMLALGHDGVSGEFPHSDYWQILVYQHGWPMLITALLGLVLTQRHGEFFSVEFVLGFTALVILVFMSYSPKISDRYVLPIMAITIYLAACGVDILARFATPKSRPWVTAILIALVGFHPVYMLAGWVQDFRGDSRADLTAWAASHLSKNDRIATSLWTRLPGFYQGQFAAGTPPPDYVADLGTLDELRKMGYSWVAVADVECRRFDNPLQAGSAASQATFLRRRSFYQDLQSQADLRWSEPLGMVYNLHPGLQLYQLRR
ncbi:MAG: glycosyltransferase family 39 protein [Chthoniobacterales bacterium]